MFQIKTKADKELLAEVIRELLSLYSQGGISAKDKTKLDRWYKRLTR